MNYLAERRLEAMRRHRVEYEQRMRGPYGRKEFMSYVPFIEVDYNDEIDVVDL